MKSCHWWKFEITFLVKKMVEFLNFISLKYINSAPTQTYQTALYGAMQCATKMALYF